MQKAGASQDAGATVVALKAIAEAMRARPHGNDSAPAASTDRRRDGLAGVRAIPAAEMTPAVRAAVDAMTREIAGLQAERARLVDRLRAVEDLADRDPLTGCLNRRAFERELDRVVDFCGRYGVESAVLYFDLDGFKQINDRHGHTAGDLVIAEVARALQAKVRGSDLVGRVGGDEFAVILTKAGDADAARKAAELSAAITAAVVVHGRSRLRVGVSTGYSMLAAGDTASEALRRADMAMYADKARLRVQSL